MRSSRAFAYPPVREAQRVGRRSPEPQVVGSKPTAYASHLFFRGLPPPTPRPGRFAFHPSIVSGSQPRVRPIKAGAQRHADHDGGERWMPCPPRADASAGTPATGGTGCPPTGGGARPPSEHAHAADAKPPAMPPDATGWVWSATTSSPATTTTLTTFNGCRTNATKPRPSGRTPNATDDASS